MDAQPTVASFITEQYLETTPPYRLLDLLSEVGEVAKEILESTEYGDEPDSCSVSSDEIGDILFATLALAEGLDIDAAAALEEALTKYEHRLEEGDTPAST